jgi:hypothetical protein
LLSDLALQLCHPALFSAMAASPMTRSFQGRQYVTIEAGSNVIAFGLFDFSGNGKP